MKIDTKKLYDQKEQKKALDKLIKWTKNYNKNVNIKNLDEMSLSQSLEYLIDGNERCDMLYDYIYLISHKMREDITTTDEKLTKTINELARYRNV